MTGNHAAVKRALQNLLPLDAGNQTLYLRAVHHYQQKDYEQATACIDQLNWKQLGKEAQGANVLLFAAMLVVERFTGKTLKKELGYLMHRLSLIEQVNEREKLCIELLEQLVQAGMNFLEVYKTQLGMLDQLRVKDGALAWNAYSGEIIAFHEWVIGKALKVAVKSVFSATHRNVKN